MVARKGRGRHLSFGTLYYRSLLIVCVTMAGLSAVRCLPCDPVFDPLKGDPRFAKKLGSVGMNVCAP